MGRPPRLSGEPPIARDIAQMEFTIARAMMDELLFDRFSYMPPVFKNEEEAQNWIPLPDIFRWNCCPLLRDGETDVPSKLLRQFLFRVYTARAQRRSAESKKLLEAEAQNPDSLPFWTAWTWLLQNAPVPNWPKKKLPRFLLQHWDYDRKGQPALIRYSDTDLCKVVAESLKMQELTVASLRWYRDIELKLPTLAEVRRKIKLEQKWAKNTMPRKLAPYRKRKKFSD